MCYLREIYKKVIEDSKYMDSTKRTIERETEKFLVNYRGSTAIEDYEEIRDIVFSVAAIAEEESFLVGFQYAVDLMLDINVQSSGLKNFNDF